MGLLRWAGERLRGAPVAETAEALVRRLYLSLDGQQRREVCLPWDYADERRGLVRRFIANHWQVTLPCVLSSFFSESQQSIILEIFLQLLDREWHEKFFRQLSDDTHGHPWGANQSIAIFGNPLLEPYQYVFTGRHLTLRVDGDAASRTAFGGPIVYAHAATGYHEPPEHPGNIFWPQALQASRIFDLLSEPQKLQALPERFPPEFAMNFRADFEGVPVGNFSPAQRAEFDVLIDLLLAPYRPRDRARVRDYLRAQGGAAVLRLAFARKRMSESAWDSWRLEGPAFIWHFQGMPHVHGWVHVAERPGAPVNARHGAFIFPEHDELR